MIAVDTCVFVRWVLRDDDAQAAVADRLLAAPFHVSISVLVELGWVLGSVGRMNRFTVAQALATLLGLPTAVIEREDHVRWAVERFAAQGDLADLLHLAGAVDAEAFATFDRGLVRAAGPNPPVRVDLLES